MFFLLATICSIIGFAESCKIYDINDDFDGDVDSQNIIDKKNNRLMRPSSIIAFGRVVHVLFQVCGGDYVHVLISFLLLK